jgi:hypothetical protein
MNVEIKPSFFKKSHKNNALILNFLHTLRGCAVAIMFNHRDTQRIRKSQFFLILRKNSNVLCNIMIYEYFYETETIINNFNYNQYDVM